MEEHRDHDNLHYRPEPRTQAGYGASRVPWRFGQILAESRRIKAISIWGCVFLRFDLDVKKIQVKPGQIGQIEKPKKKIYIYTYIYIYVNINTHARYM